MEFKYKNQEQIAKMTPEEVDNYATELRTHEDNLRKQEVDTAVEAAKKELNEKIEEANKQLKDLDATILQLKNKQKKEEVKTLKDQIIKHFQEDAEALKNLKENKDARVTMKVVGDMLISTNTTGRVARIEVDPERARIVRRTPFVLDFVNLGTTNANTYYWIEQTAPEGTPAMTAEGAAKAQIDWDYVESSAPVRKLTAFVKCSKEMLDDIDGFAQDIAVELVERITLLADEQALTGDGLGQNITGIAENATPFAGGALAGTIDDANDTDVLRAGIAQVQRQLFDPSVIFIHPDKAAVMDLEKGTDGHYLLPPFVTANGMNVRGVPVITNTGVGADDFYVGDISKYKFKIREGISIEFGYDGDDWTKNMITPLAEMRGVGFIPANHYGAIVSGTFTAAKAILETP